MNDGIATVENNVGGGSTGARRGDVLVHELAVRSVYVGTELEMEALVNSFVVYGPSLDGMLSTRSRRCSRKGRSDEDANAISSQPTSSSAHERNITRDLSTCTAYCGNGMGRCLGTEVRDERVDN